MGINEGHGERIFLTWSATEKDLPNARDLARRMAEAGTTFRGCSYDVFVYTWDDCPVCGCHGIKKPGERLAPQPAPMRSHWQPKRRKTR